MEESILIPGGSDTLVGMLYRPDAEPRYGVVMCHPLFEERKSAQRVMVDAARALMADGCAVLRFDYRGCGDSTGDFAAFSCSDWREDIVRAASVLTERTGVKRLGLLGLRLGASLAFEAARMVKTVDHAILWEPILNGRRYLDQELRRKVVREMVTFGQSRVTRAALLKELQDGRPVDLDGYALTSRLFTDLNAMDLTGLAAPRALLLAQIGTAGATGEIAGFRDTLAARGVDVDLVTAAEEPFWNLVGLVDCPRLIEATRTWLAARHATAQGGAP